MEEKYLKEKKYVVTHVYYVTRPRMVAFALTMYRCFSLTLFPRQHSINNYLHIFYTVLGIITNLRWFKAHERGGVHRSCTNITTFYIRG